MPVYLSAQNLADYDAQPSEFYRLENKRAQVAYLKERGYDGWYADMDSGGWGEISVFSPEQIKSATGQYRHIRPAQPEYPLLPEGGRGDRKRAGGSEAAGR